MDDIRCTARRLADEVLFPDAKRIDGLDAIPQEHFDALAGAGLFGASAPAAAGGLGLELPAMCSVTEELASGCLATAFVWIQHFRLLTTLAGGWTPSGSAGDWLTAACQGKLRGGVVLAGLIPGPPLLRATPADGGWSSAPTRRSRQPSSSAWAPPPPHSCSYELINGDEVPMPL
jgi:alkylation response protein AidB-like acyl-CoA dehydrogenase